jgi:hypothetical protein
MRAGARTVRFSVLRFDRGSRGGFDVACPTCKQVLADAATTLDVDHEVRHVSKLLADG